MEKVEINLVSKSLKKAFISFIPILIIIIITIFLSEKKTNNNNFFYLRLIVLYIVLMGYIAFRLKIIIYYKNKKVFIRTIFKKYLIDFEDIIGYDLVERFEYPHVCVITKDKKIKVLLTMNASNRQARIEENLRIRNQLDRLLEQLDQNLITSSTV